MSLTFGSLFAGVGGFDLGFERAGLRCAWQVELSDYCRGVLAKHWPNVRRHDDIRTFPPEGDWSVDVICGGDPCQGNSNAGSIWKAKHEDLGSELLRVVAALRPRIVVRENPSRSRPDALWPWHRMRRELQALGYAVLPFRLRSCCLGGNSPRDRLFLLACLPDADGERLAGIDGEGVETGHAGGTCGHAGGNTGTDALPAPRVCRSRNEVPRYVDRITALGNAVDPTVAEWIGRRLIEGVANVD